MYRTPRILEDAPSGRHFCQIHHDPDELTRAVVSFAAAGLRQGNGVLVAATARRLAALDDGLRKAGVGVDEFRRAGQLVTVDAEALLARIMAGDEPDPEVFRREIGALLTAVQDEGFGRTRIYGELVNVLWQAGNAAAAVTLEELWNDLARTRRFSLFCGYELPAFDADTYASPLAEIARTHTELVETEFDQRLQAAVDSASTEIFSLPMSTALCYFGRERDEAEHRLPAARRTLLWLHQNIPSAMGKVLARARVLYAG